MLYMPGYILEILNYEFDLKLGTTELDFLHRFLKGTSSVYGIYSELATQYVLRQDGKILSENVHIFQRLDSSLLGKGMAYKNVHKRIKRLAELRLIQEFDHKYPGTHGAKFYRITRKGLFFLIYSSRLYPSLIRLDNLIHYHGDPILETIFFPYFEDKSLSRYTPTFHFAISFYLAECCRFNIGTQLKALKKRRSAMKRVRV